MCMDWLPDRDGSNCVWKLNGIVHLMRMGRGGYRSIEGLMAVTSSDQLLTWTS